MKSKRILMGTLLGASILVATGCNANNGHGQTNPKQSITITEKSPELEKVGYSFGYLMGQSNKEMIDDLNVDAFDKGFRDAYSGQKSALTEEQMQQVLMDYQKKKEEEFVKERQAKAEQNKEAGEKFLAENAKKEGVKTTASGLQYKVIKEGTGKSPKATDIVKVNYEGKLIDGTIFDSSQPGQPVEFPLDKMIPGWTEGLQLMKEGGKYQLFIPASLAYGEAGNPAIEPNSTLVFDIDLLEVKPQH